MPDCAPASGMSIEALETECGPSTSAIYIPDFPDGITLRYCRPGTPCRQMWAAFFLGGRLKVWGRAYEVVR